MHQNIAEYKKWLTHLRRSATNGGAPHKPILMLAILESVREGEITSPRIRITSDVILRFKELWKRLVHSEHNENFALPFFHMGSEPFWNLVTLPGKKIPETKSHSIKSFAALRDTLQYAELHEGLFIAMTIPEENAELTSAILQKYFAVQAVPQLLANEKTIQQELTSLVLEEPNVLAQYRKKEMREERNQEAAEEYAFVRGGIFKKVIPALYDYTCAVSGMRITSADGVQMVDACHIKPFAQFGLDGVSNGICLSPTIHRAFDSGLISIDEDYKVMIKKKFTETRSTHSILQFEGQKIALPTNPHHWPSQENLGWHRGR
jgi:putative restriction endonuclease